MASSEDRPTSQNLNSDTFQDVITPSGQLEQGLREFWNRLRDIRSQSMSYEGREPSFGEGKEVLEAFEETVQYEPENIEEVLEYQEEFGFEHRSTAEIYAFLEPEEDKRFMRTLERVDNQKTLKANDIRKLVNYIGEYCNQGLDT